MRCCDYICRDHYREELSKLVSDEFAHNVALPSSDRNAIGSSNFRTISFADESAHAWTDAVSISHAYTCTFRDTLASSDSGAFFATYAFPECRAISSADGSAHGCSDSNPIPGTDTCPVDTPEPLPDGRTHAAANTFSEHRPVPSSDSATQ